MKTLRVRISGRVQGVFYRASTRKAALERNVTGWVMNMPDGSVEGVFQGSPEDVDSLLSWCAQGPSHALVKDVKISQMDSPEVFSSFEVRY